MSVDSSSAFMVVGVASVVDVAPDEGSITPGHL